MSQLFCWKKSPKLLPPAAVAQRQLDPQHGHPAAPVDSDRSLMDPQLSEVRTCSSSSNFSARAAQIRPGTASLFSLGHQTWSGPCAKISHSLLYHSGWLSHVWLSYLFRHQHQFLASVRAELTHHAQDEARSSPAAPRRRSRVPRQGTKEGHGISWTWAEIKQIS